MPCCWREKHLEQLFYKKNRNFYGSSVDLLCSSFVYTVVFEMTNQMYRTVFVYNATNLILNGDAKPLK